LFFGFIFFRGIAPLKKYQNKEMKNEKNITSYPSGRTDDLRYGSYK
jgi:hypothetical protein